MSATHLNDSDCRTTLATLFTHSVQKKTDIQAYMNLIFRRLESFDAIRPDALTIRRGIVAQILSILQAASQIGQFEVPELRRVIFQSPVIRDVLCRGLENEHVREGRSFLCPLCEMSDVCLQLLIRCCKRRSIRASRNIECYS